MNPFKTTEQAEVYVRKVARLTRLPSGWYRAWLCRSVRGVGQTQDLAYKDCADKLMKSYPDCAAREGVT